MTLIDRLIAAVIAALVAVGLLATPASAASSHGPTVFKLYPPNYCAEAEATAARWVQNPACITSISDTYSYTAGSNGICDDQEPRFYNALAVQPKVQILTASGWYTCRTGFAEYNPANSYYVEARQTLEGCAGGANRILTGHRATYAGTPYSKDYATGAV